MKTYKNENDKSEQSSGKTTGMLLRILLLLFFAAIALTACQKDEDTNTEALTPYKLTAPAGFPRLDIPADNQPYAERISLGRKLYYDAILSNNGRSCASCHVQKNGFTSASAGTPVLPHVNMAWKNTWMWNGSKQGSLEEVMQFEVEEFFATDLVRLNQHPDYPELFAEAYGVEQITSEEVAKALAQFARIMISSDSKFDRVQRSMAQFTEKEAKGYAIFNSEKGSCYHCHTPPIFTDDYLHNNGLDSSYENQANWGYFAVTGDSSDMGRMRTPSLRNVALRENYMHDGRYSSLEEVVNHYNSGVKRSRSLDPTMIKSGNTVKLKLSAEELDQLVAFLHTLTDSTFVSDEMLSRPQ